MLLQHPCVVHGSPCSGALQSLADEAGPLVQGRCLQKGWTAQPGTLICKRHADALLHWHNPQACAACPSTRGALRLCPIWLQQQLGAPAGSFVHKRPCYEEALKKRKQTAATHTDQAEAVPMEMEQVEKENDAQQSNQFEVDVRLHTDTQDTQDARGHNHGQCTNTRTRCSYRIVM
jgi:hypothetical protein